MLKSKAISWLFAEIKKKTHFFSIECEDTVITITESSGSVDDSDIHVTKHSNSVNKVSEELRTLFPSRPSLWRGWPPRA